MASALPDVPIILVAGLGRCGTSLVMQMLSAAGAPCVGTYPDFEDESVMGLLPTRPRDWIEACAGKVVKLLDPHRYPPPFGPDYRIIWLQRDHEQQAKSQLKFIGAPQSRKERKGMESLIRRETPIAEKMLRAVCRPGTAPLDLRFEEILTHPKVTAGMILLHAHDGEYDELRVQHMVSRIVQRSPDCLERSLEPALIASAAPP